MQPQEADHLDAPPPLPPRQLYVNLHIKAENAYSLQCERNQQSNPLLQPFTDTRPETEAQKRLKASGRVLYEGPVQFTFREHVDDSVYLKIYCIGSKFGRLARIEVFDSKESATNGEPALYLIPFAGVSNIQQRKDDIIVTLQNGNVHNFATPNLELLLESCLLLWHLQDHFVPEIPKCHLVLQEHTERYKDPSKYDSSAIWIVYLIHEGVGPRLNLEGLHFVTIKSISSTFNVYNFYNEKHVLAWEHCNIKGMGRTETLVYLLVDDNCEGGPGVLWMYCPDHLAEQLRASLHKFIHNDGFTKPVSIDSSSNRTQGEQLGSNPGQSPVVSNQEYLSTPVSSYTDKDSVMSRESQKSDEVSTAEHAYCTETEFQSPQQDNSDFSANVLHPSIDFTTYT